MYSKPYRPLEYRMEKKFKGSIIHSSNYKNSEIFKNESVLLIGFGNSAISIACDIAPIAKKAGIFFLY